LIEVAAEHQISQKVLKIQRYWGTTQFPNLKQKQLSPNIIIYLFRVAYNKHDKFYIECYNINILLRNCYPTCHYFLASGEGI